MDEKDSKFLKVKIDKLLNNLAHQLEIVEGDNLVSVSLAGSTVQGEMKHNQDVDILVVVKKIPGENLNSIEETLKIIVEGGLDLEYSPNVSGIKQVFEDIVKQYTDFETEVKYRFTLGNYWGEPSGKKFTIHLHVLGPHSLESLQLRLNKFHKVILSNAINNSLVLAGKDLRKLVNIDIKPEDVIMVLKMLRKRQDKALNIIETDPDLALQISIKNLGKIAMASLTVRNIFESSTVRAGKLFKQYFDLPYNDLPEQAFQFKVVKYEILKDKKRLAEIVNQTDILLDKVLDYFSH